MAKANLALESRIDRRKRRNRFALTEAANKVMTEKGIDAATMLEIAELADVGAGTVYNYFASEDELDIGRPSASHTFDWTRLIDWCDDQIVTLLRSSTSASAAQGSR